jgi:hypothetical protein
MSAELVLIGLGSLVVVILLVKAIRTSRTPKDDLPGPHNNWRRHSGSRKSEVMDENFPGLGSGSSGGGID